MTGDDPGLKTKTDRVEERMRPRVEGKEKTPSLHRLGGGVQQEFEHSFSGTEIPWSF